MSNTVNKVLVTLTSNNARFRHDEATSFDTHPDGRLVLYRDSEPYKIFAPGAWVSAEMVPVKQS